MEYRLSTPASAMTAVVITKVWLSVPLYMAFFLAGLQSIPKSLIEAAAIDGCSSFGVFWRIILPVARPALVVDNKNFPQ